MAETKIELNKAQRAAVEQIDGPMLVLAGPGTGKTQMLTARVARILQQTDTLAANILCLTFTESGAANMLERLSGFIGQAAYEVNISTYHAFGGELIRGYPEYFDGARLEQPIDELGQHEILAGIVEGLSYQNPLKSIGYHLGDLISTISDVKRGLLDASDLRKIASENLAFLQAANPKISAIFGTFSRMPGKLDKARPYFVNCQKLLASYRSRSNLAQANLLYGSLASCARLDLEQATAEADETGSTKPLTAWKNDWLIKNGDNRFILKGELEARRLEALADVLARYEAELARRGLFDYDDMILRSIDALQTNDDFRFTLQEKYQYILLDEYQDTSAAQSKLVELLTNHPASEGRPNVMAVGDDDQAIYSFQGAEASNLADFAERYDSTAIIPLSENYRSQPDILLAAAKVGGQIEDRLDTRFGLSKRLTFSGKAATPVIIRQEFLSQVAERDWVSREIERLITKEAVRPSQIAVLAPRHKLLEPLVPYLNNLDIPVRYEKRENILEAPIVAQLVTMSRLVLALSDGDENLAASYWPEVLSYEFWQNDIEAVWQLSWAADGNWTKQLLVSQLRWVGLFFLTLASMSKTETLETMLDYLIGAQQLKISDPKIKTATSPLKSYFTSREMETSQPDIFYQTISHLTVLRQKLRDRQASEDAVLKLADMIDLVGLYESSGTRMINTSPYNQASESVQLMTVFKAKGLEFLHVFLLDCVDEVWGVSARGGGNALKLPANLASLRRAGSSDDERLRLLYVALTRAKTGLYLLSSHANYAGKATTRLKYFDEREQENGEFKTLILPAKYQLVRVSSEEVPELGSLETSWQSRHIQALKQTRLEDLLAERIRDYQLSPTHLNTFIDLELGGPRAFLLNTLLKFPSAPGAAGSYGNAIHETLEWLQLEINGGKKPKLAAILSYFEKRLIGKKLGEGETERRIEQGRFELGRYLASAAIRPGDLPEVKFKATGVFLGEAHLNGKIDKLEIDKAGRALTIVDFKTGPPESRWASKLKLHKYKQQLYFYKLLVEGSTDWQGWRVAGERLDFVRPDTDGKLVSLPLKYDADEFERTKALVVTMWRLVKGLNFPDTSGYSSDFAGSRQFEDDLIAGKFD